MVISAGVAAAVALWSFWILLSIGWMREDLRIKGVGVFVGLWLAGFVGFRFVAFDLFFSTYVAVLDIALVFAVFHGDVRLN
jgi:hypothetical protein